MLRDGAAWYALPEKNGQDAREREAYQMMETQAKTEKRGVWSIENNKPAWEFRAEMQARALEEERIKREAEKAKREAERAQADRDALANALRSADFAARATIKPKINMTRQLDMWSSVSNSANANEISTGNGLLSGSVPNAGVGYVMTAGDFYDFAGEGTIAKVESRSLYIYSSGQTVNGNG